MPSRSGRGLQADHCSTSFLSDFRLRCGRCLLAFLFTLSNRLRIYFKRDQYRLETFEVTGTVNPHSRKGFSPYWLTGTIAGRAERVRPELPPTFKPQRREDLLSLFPYGSTIPVLFDPDAPEVMIQGESLRVFHFTPNFWPRENRLCIRFLCLVLLPVPLTLAFYRYVRKRAYIFPSLSAPE